MIQPAALTKARALDRHLYGANRALVSVCLCDREAWELLAWYQATEIDPAPADQQQPFLSDLARARALNDPWLMLRDFQIAGYMIERLPDEVH